jgi:hypothetical protein
MTSTGNNSNPILDYKSAAQWAENYIKNPNGADSKNNSISIFWITIVILLLALTAWWWWCNYRPSNSVDKIEYTSSPLQDLKNGGQKPPAKLKVRPNGIVSS